MLKDALNNPVGGADLGAVEGAPPVPGLLDTIAPGTLLLPLLVDPEAH